MYHKERHFGIKTKILQPTKKNIQFLFNDYFELQFIKERGIKFKRNIILISSLNCFF